MASSTVAGFDCIVIVSFLFGLLLLGTAIFSSRIHRQSHWYGFLAPLFVYDIILMLGMGYQTDTGPPSGFCAFQAILLYSIPGWAVVAFGCFIIHFYLRLRNLITGEQTGTKPRSISKRTELLLVFIPLISFVGFLLLNGIVTFSSSIHPEPAVAMNKYRLYCTPEIHTGLYFGGSIMGLAMLMWFIIIIKAGVLLRVHYSMLKRGEDIFHDVLSVYIRAMAISIAGSIVIGLYIWSYATNSEDSVFGSYCLAFPSIIIFSVFGTQRDMLKCWEFWHCKPQTDPGVSSSASLEVATLHGSNESKIEDWKNIGYNWNPRTKKRVG